MGSFLHKLEPWRRGGRYNAPRHPLWIGIISKKPLWIDVKDR